MINTEKTYDLAGFDEKEGQNIDVVNFSGDTIKEFKKTDLNIVVRYTYYYKEEEKLESILKEPYTIKFRSLEFFSGKKEEIEDLIKDVFNELKEKNNKDFIFENSDQWAYLNFSKFDLEDGRSILMYSSDTFFLKYVVSLQKLKIKETIKRTNPIALKFEKKQDFNSELISIFERDYPEMLNDIKNILK